MSSKNTYRNLVKGENFFRHFLLLAIRLYWGGLLIVAGFGKWLNLSEVTHFFATLNIPWPGFSAWLAGLIELVGGISLVLGLWSRISTLFLIALFIVAYATAHSVALINFFIAPTVFFEQPLSSISMPR